MKKNSMFRILLTMVLGLFMTIQAFAQQIAVKGTVIDDLGDPIMGANVIVKGTTNGSITDLDGNFSLTANKGDILVASFIGYVSKEVAVAANVQIQLSENAEMLQEAVVIGYGVAKKSDLTGSVTAIKPDAMNKGLVTNAQDMLAGKIAGVNVTSGGGMPGGGATIRIRGGSSLNASNDPLIVIDGLAMDNNGVKGLANPLSMVNPSDIESFTVLKDASATAIYGSRGSNGVIIITTKKGRSGTKPTVSYNGNVSMSMVNNYLDVMDGQQFGEMIESLHGVGSDAWNALTKQTNADGTYRMNGDKYLYNNTDWQKEIYQTAISTDHNITVSGGIKNMPYRVSFGYTNQDGVIKTSDFERYTISANISPMLLDDHLKLNISAKQMWAKTRYADTGAIGAAVWMDPTKPVKSNDQVYQDNFGGYFQWAKQSETLNDSEWKYVHDTNTTANPVSLLELKNNRAKSHSFVGNLEADYKVHGFEDLHLHANLGADSSFGRQRTNTSPYSATNYYYGYNGWDKIYKTNLSFNSYAQYMKDFNEANHFDIMLGYEWQHFYSEQEYDGSGFYQPTNLDSALAGQPYKQDGKLSMWESYLVSFFGRAGYTFKDRYMFTATFRYDGSSRFEDHWALFPSFAFAWKIKDEAFLKDVDALSDLKLRLGYGQTGQQDGIGNYNYFASYNVSTGNGSKYPILSNTDGTMNRPDAYNKKLTWETKTTYNAGLDFGIFNDRLTGNLDYYYSKTTDLLYTVDVPVGQNFRNQVQSNIGSLENQGAEVNLTWRAIQKDDWRWELTANASYNKNKITELVGEGAYQKTGGISAGTGNTVQAHAVGHPRNTFLVYQQVYDEKGLPIEGVYVDRNGDGVINSDDLYFYHSPDAPWTFGLASKLQYKNWDLNFSLRANLGNYVFNDTEAGTSNCNKNVIWSSFEHLSNRPTMVLEKNWQTYDNPISDYFVHNASFLKCDNITLGYSFDKLLNTKISGRVYGTVTNVFTITNYNGLDPEVFGGIDNNMYPRPFSALVGLSLNF